MGVLKSFGIVLVFGLCANPVLAQDSRVSGQTGGFPGKSLAIPDYRPFFYNYPHAISSDYVFRTARVFSPRELERPWLWNLWPTAGNSQEAGGEGQGVALSARINQLSRDLLASVPGTLGDELGEYVVAVSTFVNLDNLYATSSFGRYIEEQLLSSLQQAGLEVVELRKSPGLLISPQHGEFALSRNLDEIGMVQNAQVVLTGTYKLAGREIFVNARLLRNEDNRILASATMVVPLDSVSAQLLANESMPSRPRLAQVSLRQFSEGGQGESQPPTVSPAKTPGRAKTKKGGS